MGFDSGAGLADTGLGGLGQTAGCSGPVSSSSVGGRLGRISRRPCRGKLWRKFINCQAAEDV